MMREVDTNVDGIIEDEFSPDFEEFEADYCDLEFTDETEVLEDEDEEYCESTQDQEFYTDSESKELDF